MFIINFEKQISTDAEEGQDVCLGPITEPQRLAHIPFMRSQNPRRCEAVVGVGSHSQTHGHSRRDMSSSGGGGCGGGRYMAFSPSPSAPHSPHLSGLRSAASTALLEQEKYVLLLLDPSFCFPFLSSNLVGSRLFSVSIRVLSFWVFGFCQVLIGDLCLCESN